MVLGETDSKERTLLDFTALGFCDVLMLGRYQYAHAHSALNPHSHSNVYEICTLERGRQTYTVEGKQYDLVGGDVLVTCPNEVHGTGGAPEEPGVLYWVEFREPPRGQRFLNLAPQDAEPFFAAYQSLPARVFKGGSELRELMDRIIEMYGAEKDPLRIVNLQNLLMRLLLDILMCSRQHKDSQISPAIRSALSHMERDLSHPLVIDNVAQRVDLSPSHFKARFRMEMGITPAEYDARRRVEKAQERLRNTEVSITRIAHELGFRSSQHFATVFKRYRGVTPRQYRQGKLPTIPPAKPVIGAGVTFHPVAD